MAVVGTSRPAPFTAEAAPVQSFSSRPAVFAALAAPTVRFYRRQGATLAPVRAGVRVGDAIEWLTPPLS